MGIGRHFLSGLFLLVFSLPRSCSDSPKVRAKRRNVSNIERSYLTVDAVINSQLSPRQPTQRRLIPWWALVWSPVEKVAFMKVNPSPVHSPLCFTKHWVCRPLLLQPSLFTHAKLSRPILIFRLFLDTCQTSNPRVHRSCSPRSSQSTFPSFLPPSLCTS